MHAGPDPVAGVRQLRDAVADVHERLRMADHLGHVRRPGRVLAGRDGHDQRVRRVRRWDADGDLHFELHVGQLRLVRRRAELPGELDLHLRRVLRVAGQCLPLIAPALDSS